MFTNATCCSLLAVPDDHYHDDHNHNKNYNHADHDSDYNSEGTVLLYIRQSVVDYTSSLVRDNFSR